MGDNHKIPIGVTLTRIERPNGSIEIIKNVTNLDGSKEKIVTRIVENKLYSIHEKTNDDGVEEIIENFENLDENELEDFNKTFNQEITFRTKTIKDIIFGSLLTRFKNKRIVRFLKLLK